jgi:hypothetical protein
MLRVILPGEASKLTFEGRIWHIVEQIDQLVAKLSPTYFGEKFIDSGAPLWGRQFPLLRGSPNLSGRYFTKL